jgi:3-methyladenine DNA glycosylase AlkD
LIGIKRAAARLRHRHGGRHRRPAVASATTALVRRDIRELANPRAALFLQRFFKTGRGEYAAGDRFLGIRVPELRHLARQYRALPRQQTLALLRSRWHEERLLALLILVDQYRRANEADRRAIYRAYLANIRHVDNWDLVDLSAEHIVGAHLTPNRLSELEGLARAESLWERRIAIMATFRWIKQGTHAPTLRIAELLLNDPHDLIHKAVGWMLREVGKRDIEQEELFLRHHYRRMPRTMLRYAIEQFPEQRRLLYLRGRA